MVAFQIIDGQAVVVQTRKRIVGIFNEVATDIWKFLEKECTNITTQNENKLTPM